MVKDGSVKEAWRLEKGGPVWTHSGNEMEAVLGIGRGEWWCSRVGRNRGDNGNDDERKGVVQWWSVMRGEVGRRCGRRFVNWGQIGYGGQM